MTIALIFAAFGQYAQPGYTQTYAQAVYQWVPVLDASQYYGGLVASAVRAEQAKQQQAQADADLNARLADLAAQVKALADRIGGVPQPGPNPGPAPQPPDQPPPPPVPQPPGPQPVPFPPGYAKPPEDVAPILKASCVKCHGADDKVPFVDADGGWVDFGPDLLDAVEADVLSGRMPKGGNLLPNEQYKPFQAWRLSRVDEIVESAMARVKAKK